jgi:predicted O-methyltransferase YrrM
MVHPVSTTCKNDFETRQRVEQSQAANAGYFERKWGPTRECTFRSEIRRTCYSRPWNDPSRPLHAWEGRCPDTLQILSDRARSLPSDIAEHLEVLHRFASTCRHVTEFGTRTGVSTTALLAAQPQKLVCYDLRRSREAIILEAVAKEPGRRTTLHFHQEDVLTAQIEPTELLFIDTLHTREQLSQELARHAASVSKYLVFHDTETFGRSGETPETQGIWPAIAEYLQQHPEWRLLQHRTNNNGLTVLTRLG